MTDAEPTVASIDLTARWEGTCAGCNRDATVFMVKFTNGAWGRRCKPCAGSAVAL